MGAPAATPARTLSVPRLVGLAELRDRIAQTQKLTREAPAALPTAVGGLRLGGLHEWFAGTGTTGRDDRRWTPPLTLLADAAARGVALGLVRKVVWIGRACWPAPLHLAGRPGGGGVAGLLDASVYVDPPSAASRLWCAEVAARAAHPTLVIADGSGCTLTHSRRLQLGAAAGGGLCLLARPAHEMDELSVACTRWLVEPVAADAARGPRWTVALLRDKDRPVMTDRTAAAAGTVTLEWDHAQGVVRVAAALAGGPAAAGARAS